MAANHFMSCPSPKDTCPGPEDTWLFSCIRLGYDEAAADTKCKAMCDG